MRRSTSRRCIATLEGLEERVCLADGVGWDGPGRGRAALTFYIANTPSSLSRSAVVAAVKAALNAWSKVAAVTFTQTYQANRTDSIDITFRPIDGRGGTLAQSYFPDDINPARIAGDIQFDSAERWEVGNAQGGAAFDLVLTAVHEIGHSLGLDHSRVAGSIMAATISPGQRFSGLAASDVTSILGLYARAGLSTATRARATATAAGLTALGPSTADESPASPTLTPPGSLPRFPWTSWAWRPRTAWRLPA